MKQLSNGMHAISTWWTAILSLFIFATFIAVVLPNQAEEAEAITGDVGSPDSGFFYTAEELYGWAEAYGEDGRQAYIRARWTFDVVWPLVYVFFLGTWISWSFRALFPAGSLWQWANLVPILGGIFDFLENGAASIVMARYPETTPIVDSLTSLFTMIKWTFVNGSFVVLVGGALIGVLLWAWSKRPAGGG